jgi:hypothetical protein
MAHGHRDPVGVEWKELRREGNSVTGHRSGVEVAALGHVAQRPALHTDVHRVTRVGQGEVLGAPLAGREPDPDESTAACRSFGPNAEQH